MLRALQGTKLDVMHIHQEFQSKNCQGGLNNLNVENKVAHQFENTTGNGMCHVMLLYKYFEKLPADARKADVFYFILLSFPNDLCIAGPQSVKISLLQC